MEEVRTGSVTGSAFTALPLPEDGGIQGSRGEERDSKEESKKPSVAIEVHNNEAANGSSEEKKESEAVPTEEPLPTVRKESSLFSLVEGFFPRKKSTQRNLTTTTEAADLTKEDLTKSPPHVRKPLDGSASEGDASPNDFQKEGPAQRAQLQSDTATSPSDLLRLYQTACKGVPISPNSKAIAQLQLAILENTPLSALDLKGSLLNERKNCDPLVELLELNTAHMTNLNLGACQLRDTGLESFARVVPKLRRLMGLNLSQNAFGNMKPLTEMLRGSALTHLDLSGNDFRGSRGVTLVSALSSMASAKLLVLNQTKLNEKAIATLVMGLRSNATLTHLQLGNNDIEVRGAGHLAQLLCTNSSLRYLELRNNNIKDKGVESIAAALEVNRTLKGLDLSNNRIGRPGVQRVSNALVCNDSLEDLNMDSNQMDEPAVVGLKAGLLQNCTLMRLGLANCEVSSEGAICLAEALAGNSSLRSLDIRQNDIGIAGLMALALSIKVNTTLCSLAYDGDDASGEGALERGFKVQIAEYCKRNKEELHRQLEEERKLTSVSVLSSSGDHRKTRAMTALNEADLQEVPL